MVVRMKTGFSVVAGMVLAGGAALGAAAQQQTSTVPDAQIEANVLKALATAPELSTQSIQSTTVYGVVTLSGAATDEASRTKAENLVARVSGVKKVVDELTLGTSDSNQGAPAQQAGNTAADSGGVLQSDGTYAPSAQERAAQLPQTQGPPPARGQAGPPPDMQANGNYPQANGNYPQPNQGGYPQRRAMYGQQQGYPQQAYPQGGQVGGKPVVVPSGAMIQIRINQGLSSHHAQPGTIFDGTVLNDIVADGAIAIPRGAHVQGVIADARKAGALKGKGELALQLTNLTLGGQTYPLASDIWDREGASKTGRTVGSAVALGAVGALFGGAIGGGAGAAAGAGIGGAAGIASSAASPGGNLIVPPEAVLTFHLAQPTPVTTVSQQEMSRLAYAAGSGNGGPQVDRRRYAPYPPYPPPAYGYPQ